MRVEARWGAGGYLRTIGPVEGPQTQNRRRNVMSEHEVVIATKEGPVHLGRRVLLTLAAWSQEPASLTVQRAASLMGCTELQCVEAMQVLGAQRGWGMARWVGEHCTRGQRISLAEQRLAEAVANRDAEQRRAAEIAEIVEQERAVHRAAALERRRAAFRQRQRVEGVGWKCVPRAERRRRMRALLIELQSADPGSLADAVARHRVPYYSGYRAWRRMRDGQRVVCMEGVES
jgi:hypothetical protein